MTDSVPSTLNVILGSAQPIVVIVVDENGDNEDMSTVTEARFVIKATENSAALVERTDADGISIDAVNDKLVIDPPTEEEIEDLTPGIYLADVALKRGGDWVYTDRFYVNCSLPLSAEGA
jgi:hypothetical protein